MAAYSSYNVFLDSGEIAHMTASEDSEFDNLAFISQQVERYYPSCYILRIEPTEPF